MSFNETVVNLSVGHSVGSECLKNNVGRQKELLLMIDEFDHAVTVGQIMCSNCLCKQIFSDASHHDSVGREETTSIDEGWSLESNWIITFGLNQHSYDSLIAIDNKIASEFKTVLSISYQLLFCKLVQITEFTADHNGNVSEVDSNSLLWLIIKFTSNRCNQRSRVSQRSNSAFVWEHFVFLHLVLSISLWGSQF